MEGKSGSIARAKSVSVDILQFMTEDHRRHAPATARNRDVILAVLQRHLPSKGNVLEIASGTGEHILYFAQASSPDLVFQPTDPDATARASTDAWVASHGVSNVRRAIELDATGEVWPVTNVDAVLCINMVHIAPWAATEGLVRGAARRGYCLQKVCFISTAPIASGAAIQRPATRPSIHICVAKIPRGAFATLKRW